jgi:hypothetical protein
MNKLLIGAGISLSILSVMAVRHANSAEFISKDGCGGQCVTVKGDIFPNDDKNFVKFIEANKIKKAVVYLDSYGGELFAGLLIGATIYDHRFATFVPKGAHCSSMCAAIWLSGRERFVEEGASIGFHSMWECADKKEHKSDMDDCKKTKVSKKGNKIISEYYDHIGMSNSAIKWLTSAKPDSMNYLQPDVADKYNITFTWWAPKEEQEQKADTDFDAKLLARQLANPLRVESKS